MDSTGNVIICEVEYTSLNQVELRFSLHTLEKPILTKQETKNKKTMALKIVSGLDATSISLSSFLDLQKNELRSAQIHNLNSTQIAGITSPASGQFAYDTTLNKLKVYNGTAWELVGASADETVLLLAVTLFLLKHLV